MSRRVDIESTGVAAPLENVSIAPAVLAAALAWTFGQEAVVISAPGVALKPSSTASCPCPFEPSLS